MPIVPIVVGVLFLVGIAALVLSRTTWRWYNITLVALSILMTIVWFYLAVRTLKTQANWRNEVAQYQKDIDQLDTQNEELIKGNPQAEPPEPSLSQRKVAVEKMLQGRGRVWDKVARKSVSPAGVIVATVDHPDPHGIEPKNVFFVFDDADVKDGGQFLGQFEVTAVNGQQVTLTPVFPVRPLELQQLTKKAGTPLVLYEIMPADSHEAFTELDDATRAALLSGLPADVQQEYAKDEKVPAADEPQTDRIWRRVKALKDFDVAIGQGANQETQHITAGAELVFDPKSAQERIAAGDVEPVAENDKVYVRPLRDYAQLYRDLDLQLEALNRNIAEVNGQIATVQEADRKAKQDIDYRQSEIANLNQDLTHFKDETAMMSKHVAALEARIADLDGERRQLFAKNRELEQELSSLVHQAADEINRRTAAAQASNR